MKTENFYHKIVGANSENIELYIGKSSGNQILKDLYKAEKEVLIISPYVGEEKVDLLLDLKERGIDVKLAFSSLNDKQEYGTLKKLIKQNQITNEPLKNEIQLKNKKLRLFNKIILLLIVVVLGVLAFKIYDIYTNDLKPTKDNLQFLKIGFYSFLGLLILSWRNKSKIKSNAQTQIYSYEYEENIKFKYLNKDFRKDKMFIHSKIYIIDDNVAYLGSVNFTHNGFVNNFETRIRITDKEAIKRLKLLVNDIFDGWNFKSNSLKWLSDKVYKEPKY